MEKPAQIHSRGEKIIDEEGPGWEVSAVRWQCIGYSDSASYSAVQRIFCTVMPNIPNFCQISIQFFRKVEKFCSFVSQSHKETID